MHLPNGLESLKSLGTDAPEMVVEGQRCVLQPLAIDRRPCKGTASSDTHDVITSGCATHFPPPPPPPRMLCQIAYVMPNQGYDRLSSTASRFTGGGGEVHHISTPKSRQDRV